MIFRDWSGTAAGLLLFAVAASAQDSALDPNLPQYVRVEGVTGTIKSAGSDTMNNLMTLWCEGFRKEYPNVTVEIEGKGSSTAPTALIAGTANFGPMSRPMKSKEIDEFQQKFGYKPVEIPTAIDMLAVYVHRDNPIKGLTLQQVDAIFSKTRKGGFPQEIRRWDQLGLTGAWNGRLIVTYGRNAASGTYGYFKERALFGGDFKDSVKEQPGSSSVVQGVSTERTAIGYSGIGYKTADVRAVPLAESPGAEFVSPTAENIDNYPLSRTLNIAINYKPGSKLDPLRLEFVKYILSKQGQSQVIKDGYLPLTADAAKEALALIGVE